MARKKRKRKSKLARTFKRLFLSSEFGPAWLMVTLTCAGAFAFSLFSGYWLIFGMFAVTGLLLIGGIAGAFRLQRWIHHERPAPEGTVDHEPADWSAPCWQPSEERDDWNSYDTTPEPETYGPITNLPNSFN